MNALSEPYDAIILGAGGAGLMCAAVAGQRGRRILLIDHANQAGKKILISGGGRCNFTNIHTSADRFISANPHFVKSALGRYTPQDFIALVESYKIAWHEKEKGQLFCDGSAKQIVGMLLSECEKGSVEIALGQEVGEIVHDDGLYSVSYGRNFARAKSVVIATGGPSIPKMGASDFAYDLARQFGLNVVEPRPALVPLKLNDDELLFRELSGVSTDVIVRCGKVEFEAAALFTHKGLSGPAILQISSYWKNGDQIEVNFLPAKKPSWLREAKRQSPKQTLRKTLATLLPDRLATALVERLSVEGDIGNLTDVRLQEVENNLANWPFIPSGSEGFAKAEVTVGGVSTNDLSSKTLEAKQVSGLYVIGEAVDVTGWLGGYNFQWAWASGWTAGQVL
jgi:predicted Rossmann fold flavoprotein